MSDDLLEDAIRAGVARGMDDAPVVPDLAERVRALPPAKRHWKLPAAAAAAVIAVLAIGVTASMPRTTTHMLTLPEGFSPSMPRTVTVSPYSTAPVTNDDTTAARAVGIWDPMWVAGYDGPNSTAALTVQGPKNALGNNPRFRASVVAGCEPEASLTASLTSTGSIAAKSSRGAAAACLFAGRYIDSAAAAWAAAYGRSTRLQVLPGNLSMTLYDGDVPVAQLHRRLAAASQSALHVPTSSSATGLLPKEIVGSWTLQYSGLATTSAAITFGSDGSLSGSGGCNYISGSYRVEIGGAIAFPSYRLRSHSCPEGTKPTWQPSPRITQAGIYGDLLSLYDGQAHVLAILHRVSPTPSAS